MLDARRLPNSDGTTRTAPPDTPSFAQQAAVQYSAYPAYPGYVQTAGAAAVPMGAIPAGYHGGMPPAVVMAAVGGVGPTGMQRGQPMTGRRCLMITLFVVFVMFVPLIPMIVIMSNPSRP